VAEVDRELLTLLSHRLPGVAVSLVILPEKKPATPGLKRHEWKNSSASFAKSPTLPLSLYLARMLELSLSGTNAHSRKSIKPNPVFPQHRH
jgi:hypothetical protein